MKRMYSGHELKGDIFGTQNIFYLITEKYYLVKGIEKKHLIIKTKVNLVYM